MFCPVSPGDIFQTIFCEISNFRQFINSYLVKEIRLGKCCLGKRFSSRSQPPARSPDTHQSCLPIEHIDSTH
jgi:hypothetical protein